MTEVRELSIDRLIESCEDKLYAIVLNGDVGAYEIQANDDRFGEFTDELAKSVGFPNALPDEVAVELAKRDGIKTIPPSELPISFERFYEGWLDFPENRRTIEKDAEITMHLCRPFSDFELYKLTETVYETKLNGIQCAYTLETLEPDTPEDRKRWGVEATMDIAIKQYQFHGGKIIPENELPHNLPKSLKEQVYLDTPETREAIQKIADIEKSNIKAKARKGCIER